MMDAYEYYSSRFCFLSCALFLSFKEFILISIAQEVGCNHAQSVGFSTDGFATTLTMRKLNLIWVTARMHIEIYKYPAW